MPRAGGSAVGADVAVASLPDLFRLVDLADVQVVRMLLVPFQAGLLAVDPDREVVLFADGDLAGVQDALGPVVELEQAVAVVVHLASLDEGRQIGADVRDLQAGDVLGQVRGVGADVADAAAGAGLLGVGPPTGLHLAGLLEGRGQPALRVLHDDLADLAQIALSHHVAGQLDHRVAGVVVHQAEDQARLLHELLQLLGLLGVEGHGLLAHDVEARLEEVPRDREVPVVGRRDRDEVDPLLRRAGRTRP